MKQKPDYTLSRLTPSLGNSNENLKYTIISEMSKSYYFSQGQIKNSFEEMASVLWVLPINEHLSLH